ncbi:hypothetical protein ABZ319_06685 [Nocardia sp. NPDC005978]|uniref:hypothetical protein n=1 Tax=Nocardia sp. NPDC005978 TaxID=3156725 RepID=UPI0033AE1142
MTEHHDVPPSTGPTPYLPLLLDLVAGYLEHDHTRVAATATDIRDAGRPALDGTMQEAGTLIAHLHTVAFCAGQTVHIADLQDELVQLVSRAVPLHHEFAIARALEAITTGVGDGCPFGPGDTGDLLLLHTAAAYCALAGTTIFGTGAFTPNGLRLMGLAARSLRDERTGR